MQNSTQVKRKKRYIKTFVRIMQKKLWIFYLAVCILLIALLARIMYIQHTSGVNYEKQVLSQLTYDSTVIPYKRGDIVDRNGTVIATSIDVYSMILDSYVLSRNPDTLDSTITYIKRFFPDINELTIRDQVRNHPDSRYFIMKKEISYEDMKAFTELMEDTETKNKISGVWFEKNYKRVYPYGSLAADVIGFTLGDGNGAIGLENSYNDILSGINGRTYGYMADGKEAERHTTEPENGKTLRTTLDINIQNILEQEIKAFNVRLGGESGKGSLSTAGLIMIPDTGEILAMADYPTFDLNNPRDLSGLYSEEALEAMSSDEKLDVLNALWQNFTIMHTYEPGSTFKPFTIACGLETGALSGGEVFYCDGGEQIGPNYVACNNRNGHGMETVEKALMDSCNDALMQMSYRISPQNFSMYQKLFGFGQRTNIDITGEARTDALLYGEEELGRTINIATNSFGQNFNVTMIQLASAYCSLINGGNLFEPHIVKSINDSRGGVIKQNDPVIAKKTVSKETSSLLTHYLNSVVSGGTGKLAKPEGYTMGGKTGTAEKLPRGHNNYVVSFIGHVSAEKPQVVIYVVIDEPSAPDQSRSAYAMEIVKNVSEKILPYLNVEREVILE